MYLWILFFPIFFQNKAQSRRSRICLKPVQI